MKKILITCWAMEIGGVERSLVGLLNAIDYSKYEVDLFLCRHEGEFMEYIPSQVHLLPEIKKYTMFQKPIKDVFQQGFIKLGAKRCLQKWKVKTKAILGRQVGDSLLGYYSESCLTNLPPIADKTYDLALSFLAPHYFTRYKVKAKRYIAWIHTDYTALDIDRKAELTMWQAYDYIAGVSQKCIESFEQIFPELKERTIEIENILSPKLIKQQAEVDVSSEMPVEPGVIKLCTVGRFSTAKGFDNAVKICKKLVDSGCKLKWYAIGYGGDETMIRNLIVENHLEDKFIILGKKTNPYPYMKACDIYIQPSRYEGKAVAVREAQILGKIPIITKFKTASSQLEDGVDGIIVPMNIEKCAEEIAAVIKSKRLRINLEENIKKRNYGNEEEVEKIYRIIDEDKKETHSVLRVLQCVGKMNCGGAETMLMNIYRNIDREKITFDFLVHNQGEGYYDAEIIKEGGHIYYIPSQGNLGIIRYIQTLTRFLKENGPFDIIHSHMDWQGGMIAVAAKMAGIKKVVVHSHTTELMNPSLAYQVVLRMQKLCIGICATDYWACSEAAVRFLFYKGLCCKRNIQIIPNGIQVHEYMNLNREESRKLLRIEKDTFLIGNVGSLSPIKNQIFLVELAKELKMKGFQFKLLLVGGGQDNYRKQVEEQINKYDLKKEVTLLGLRKDIPSIMCALDLFVLPSLFEGLGIAAIEAQAAGTPSIVSTNVPREVDMGLDLVSWLEIESIEDWKDKILSMVPVEERNGSRCYKAISEKGYNVLESAKKVEALYRGEISSLGW